jgi:c-di-GMP-binding flagellar brake protein YcgR
MTERRRFMRFDAFLDVMHSALEGPAIKLRSCLKDLSKEGMRISGENPLRKGSIIELEMKIPGDNVPVFATGEVAWSEKADKTAYDSGIRITKIESLDRAKLLDYVYDEWIRTKKEKNQFTETEVS